LIIEDFGGWDLFQELLNALQAIGTRHGVGLGDVATRWVIDQDQVGCAIMGFTSTRHLPATQRIEALRLDAQDNALLTPILARRTGPAGDCYDIERDKEERAAAAASAAQTESGKQRAYDSQTKEKEMFFEPVPDDLILQGIVTGTPTPTPPPIDAATAAMIQAKLLELDARTMTVGYEQQRLAIARALLNSPELILADEPTGNLDPETSIEIVELLRSLATDGCAVMMASHDVHVMNKFTARRIRIENGHLLE
jgi:hypothetical protein